MIRLNDLGQIEISSETGKGAATFPNHLDVLKNYEG
mgnify:CR=1 FL=1